LKWIPEKYLFPNMRQFDWLNNFAPGLSITAIEIYQGILRDKEKSSRAFFYFRNPHYSSQIPQSILQNFLYESPDSQIKLNTLKDKIRNSFQKFNVLGHITENYSCSYVGLKMNWNLVKSKIQESLSEEEINIIKAIVNQDNIIDTKDFDVLNDHLQKIILQNTNISLNGLEKFGESVLKDLWESILEEYPDINRELDIWENEREIQNLKKMKLVELFQGRTEILKKIESYIRKNEQSTPLVFIGERGIGLSSLIAASSLTRDTSSSEIIITRFSGISVLSSNIDSLLISISKELSSVLEIELSEACFDDFNSIKETFNKILNNDKPNRRLIIFIDAIDKLNLKYKPQYLTWIPAMLGPNTKIILSTSSDIFIESANRLTFELYPILSLSDDDKCLIINKTLEIYRKSLSSDQIALLLKKTDSKKPLYLSICCEELRLYSNFEEISDRIKIFPDTLEALILQFFERLEVDFGYEITKKLLSIIASSISGITEGEILQAFFYYDEYLKYDNVSMLSVSNKSSFAALKKELFESELSGTSSMPKNKWIKFYYQLKPYLSNTESEFNSFRFSNELFESVAKEKYFNDPPMLKKINFLHGHNVLSIIYYNPDVISPNVKNCLKYFFLAEKYKSINPLLIAIFSSNDEFYNKYKTMFIGFLNWYIEIYSTEKFVQIAKILDPFFVDNTTYITVANVYEDTQLFAIEKIIDGCTNTYNNLTVGKLRAFVLEKKYNSILDLEKNTKLKVNRMIELLCDFSDQLAVNEPEWSIAFSKYITDKTSYFNSTYGWSCNQEIILSRFNSLANLLTGSGNYVEAELYFQKMTKFIDKFMINSDNLEHIRIVTYYLNNYGLYISENGNVAKAISLHQKAIEILIKHRDHTDLVVELARNYNNLFTDYLLTKDFEKAFLNGSLSLEALDSLVNTDVNEDLIFKEKARALNNMAVYYLRIGDIRTAFGYLNQSCSLKEKFYIKYPENIELIVDLASSYFNIASLSLEWNNFNDVLKFVTKSEKLLANNKIVSNKKEVILQNCYKLRGGAVLKMKENGFSSEDIQKILFPSSSNDEYLDFEKLAINAFRSQNWKLALEYFHELKSQNISISKIDYYMAQCLINSLECYDINLISVINNHISKTRERGELESVEWSDELEKKLNEKIGILKGQIKNRKK